MTERVCRSLLQVSFLSWMSLLIYLCTADVGRKKHTQFQHSMTERVSRSLLHVSFHKRIPGSFDVSVYSCFEVCQNSVNSKNWWQKDSVGLCLYVSFYIYTSLAQVSLHTHTCFWHICHNWRPTNHPHLWTKKIRSLFCKFLFTYVRVFWDICRTQRPTNHPHYMIKSLFCKFLVFYLHLFWHIGPTWRPTNHQHYMTERVSKSI